MRYLILVLLVCIYLLSKAQIQTDYTDSVYVIDNNSQKIIVIKDIGFGYPSYFTDTSIFITPNSIILKCCYFVSEFNPWAQSRTDSVALGAISLGTYNVTIICLGYTQDCDNAKYEDTSYLSFTVNALSVEKTETHKVLLSPNPTTNKLTCIISANPSQAYYQVLSIDGKLLINNTAITQPHFEVDVLPLASGVYYLVLLDDKERTVKRFVKY